VLDYGHSSEANTEIPDKGPSTHPIMKNISISNKGILKLINNINPKKAVGPDNIAGKILQENADISSDILLPSFTKNKWKQGKFHLIGTMQM
jgi:hypothetical protein